MNGLRLEHILALDKFSKDMFHGFSTPDLPLPKLKKLPSIVILNTGLSTTDGEHWCVACFRKDRTCDFFDPYGYSPSFYGFTKQLLKSCQKFIRFNEKPVQGFLSKTCGHHSIFFALKYSRGYDPDEIMACYHPVNRRFNDNMVYAYLIQKSDHVIASVAD